MQRSFALASFCFLLVLRPAFAQTETAAENTPVLAPAQEMVYVPVGYDVQWTFTAEALWLQRATAGPISEALPTVGPPVSQAFVGNQFQPGVRVGLWRQGVDGNFWEASYFGQNYWSDDKITLGDPVGFTFLAFSPSLRLDDVIGGFDTSITTAYRANVNNAELNRWWLWRQNDRWTVKPMVGFRYFNFTERLSMVGIDSNFGTETYDAVANNNLVGGQVGLRVDRTFDRLNLFGIAKAGLYGNFWSYRVDDVVTSVGAPLPPIHIANTGTSTAGLLEFQLGSSYRLNDWASIIGSYNLYYVPGVTLQPTTLPVGPNHADGLVLHGGSIGLMLNW